jgi:hypothetical protein
MDKFTEAEKNELRRAAHSKELREDFRHISRNRHQFRTTNGNIDIDTIVRYVADINTLVNHTPKPFKKITGNSFKM